MSIFAFCSYRLDALAVKSPLPCPAGSQLIVDDDDITVVMPMMIISSWRGAWAWRSWFSTPRSVYVRFSTKNHGFRRRDACSGRPPSGPGSRRKRPEPPPRRKGLSPPMRVAIPGAREKSEASSQKTEKGAAQDQSPGFHRRVQPTDWRSDARLLRIFSRIMFPLSGFLPYPFTRSQPFADHHITRTRH